LGLALGDVEGLGFVCWAGIDNRRRNGYWCFGRQVFRDFFREDLRNYTIDKILFIDICWRRC
jgi:hypothetical protein